MVSRPSTLLLSLLVAGGNTNVSASSSSPDTAFPWEGEEQPSNNNNNLRGSSAEIVTDEPNIPTLSKGRRALDDGGWTSVLPLVVPSERTKEVRTAEGTTITISEKCLNDLILASGDNERLGKEDYFVFNELTSNSYYASQNITEYDELPITNKFAFVTLSCQCHAFGGSGNCCQGPRAYITLTGITDESTTWSDSLTEYIADTCSTTMDAIGVENILPPSGEGSWTKKPTNAPTVSSVPTVSSMPSMGPTVSSAPTVSVQPSVVPTVSAWPSESPSGSGAPSAESDKAAATVPTGGGNSTDGLLGGLSSGAWAGIAIAGAAVITLLTLAIFGPRRGANDEENDSNASSNDNDLEQMSQQDNAKELLAITAGGDLSNNNDDDDTQTEDATHDCTASDVSSIPSMSTSGGGGGGLGSRRGLTSLYANESLLGTRPEDSFTTDEDSLGFGGGGLAAKDSLNAPDTPGSLDQAIESGNWEQVAASAAKYVMDHDESMPSSTSGVEV